MGDEQKSLLEKVEEASRRPVPYEGLEHDGRASRGGPPQSDRDNQSRRKADLSAALGEAAKKLKRTG
jgi:hypothetical protein